MKTVAAIVVTYLPEKDHFRKLLSALKGQVQKIIIVDNSPADHVDHEMGGDIIFISNKNNIGLAAAQNQGIERALSDGATDIILFDQDSLPRSDMVHHLLQAQDVLAMQGLRVSSVGPVALDCRSGRRAPFFRLKGCSFEKVATSSEGAPVPCIYTIASGQLINRNCLHSVGLMRDDFFIDYIDIEWGLRANQKGYLAYGVPADIMQHRVGDNVIRVLTKEIPVHSPLRSYFMVRNAITLYRDKNVPFSWKVADVKSLAKKLLVTVFFGCNRFNHMKNIMKACKESILK